MPREFAPNDQPSLLSAYCKCDPDDPTSSTRMEQDAWVRILQEQVSSPAPDQLRIHLRNFVSSGVVPGVEIFCVDLSSDGSHALSSSINVEAETKGLLGFVL